MFGNAGGAIEARVFMDKLICVVCDRAVCRINRTTSAYVHSPKSLPEQNGRFALRSVFRERVACAGDEFYCFRWRFLRFKPGK